MDDGRTLQLIRRARDGDDLALATLFAEHERVLRARVRRHLSPRMRRRVGESDVLQEARIVAARRLDDFEYRGAGSFGRWLARIADLSTRGVAKRQLARKRTPEAEDSRPVVGVSVARGRDATPSNHAIGGELLGRLAGALRKMSEDHRTVIHLLQNRKLTIAEAAEVMQRSSNALKKLHARALTTLAAHLDL